MNESIPKRIGIAVVEHSGRYLVGTRGPDAPLAGCAEFPGGKCRPDESPEACAIRECQEETQLSVTTERLLRRCEFEYPHATVDLHFFLCRPSDSSEVLEDHNGFRWISVDQLKQCTFPEANAAVIEMIVAAHQRRGIPE